MKKTIITIICFLTIFLVACGGVKEPDVSTWIKINNVSLGATNDWRKSPNVSNELKYIDPGKEFDVGSLGLEFFEDENMGGHDRALISKTEVSTEQYKDIIDQIQEELGEPTGYYMNYYFWKTQDQSYEFRIIHDTDIPNNLLITIDE